MLSFNSAGAQKKAPPAHPPNRLHTRIAPDKAVQRRLDIVRSYAIRAAARTRWWVVTEVGSCFEAFDWRWGWA